MKPTPELIRGLKERFAHAVVAYVDADGYPMSVATEFEVDEQSGTVVLRAVAGEEQPPHGEQVNVVFSHIRPQPGIGYDERRYVSLWGQLRQTETGLELSPERVQGWDEQAMSFFEYSERGVGQAHRYLEQVSEETGREVRPKLSFGWLFLRATRLPFLTATFVPVLLGIAVAAWTNGFSWWLALLTVIGGACIHLGLNVANDVFDTTSGADAANVNPTQFSGGSRVVHYGLLTLREITLLSAGFYAVGIGIGIYLAATRGWDLLWLGIAGALLSVFYTAPPLKLVHRGLGEIDVFLGFGPIMVLGAYYVQAQEYDLEPLLVSIPVGILIALVLYVNEVPDRPADAKADKRTLPVRFSKDTIVNGVRRRRRGHVRADRRLRRRRLDRPSRDHRRRRCAARASRLPGAQIVLRPAVRVDAGDGQEHPAPSGDRRAPDPRLRDRAHSRRGPGRPAVVPDVSTEFVSAVPIIPAREVETSAAWYRDRLGFTIFHTEDEYGIVGRGETWIHFWGPSGIPPEKSDTMIRVGVRGIDALYEHCQAKEIVHPNALLEEKPWGFREFAVIDHDGNLVTFFEPPADYEPQPG